jgi:hypothetical protein
MGNWLHIVCNLLWGVSRESKQSSVLFFRGYPQNQWNYCLQIWHTSFLLEIVQDFLCNWSRSLSPEPIILGSQKLVHVFVQGIPRWEYILSYAIGTRRLSPEPIVPETQNLVHAFVQGIPRWEYMPSNAIGTRSVSPEPIALETQNLVHAFVQGTPRW